MTKRAGAVIDAHQHFWDPGAADYPWMVGEFEPLRSLHSPAELAPLLESAGVTATVAVQARQELDETRFLLETAAQTRWIAGVVGWVDLTDAALAETLAEIMEGPVGDRLVGVRHLVHDEADPEWLLRDDVSRGLGAVAEAGLAYDLLVRTRELPAANQVARRLPGLRFVVDHLAKPPVSAGTLEPWATLIGEIARLPNVVCKVSGLVTEADWASWKPTDLRPYIGRIVDIFGTKRLMFGSDWPVCTLAADYRQVLEVTIDILDDLVGDDLDWILARCSAETYRLDLGKDAES